jgi:hypothetical protein
MGFPLASLRSGGLMQRKQRWRVRLSFVMFGQAYFLNPFMRTTAKKEELRSLFRNIHTIQLDLTRERSLTYEEARGIKPEVVRAPRSDPVSPPMLILLPLRSLGHSFLRCPSCAIFVCGFKILMRRGQCTSEPLRLRRTWSFWMWPRGSCPAREERVVRAWSFFKIGSRDGRLHCKRREIERDKRYHLQIDILDILRAYLDRTRSLYSRFSFPPNRTFWNNCRMSAEHRVKRLCTAVLLRRWIYRSFYYDTSI